MEETKQEFEQEIKTALGYLLEIEKHAGNMDSDDLKVLCGKIRFPLERMLRDIQSGNAKAKKW